MLSGRNHILYHALRSWLLHLERQGPQAPLAHDSHAVNQNMRRFAAEQHAEGMATLRTKIEAVATE